MIKHNKLSRSIFNPSWSWRLLCAIAAIVLAEAGQAQTDQDTVIEEERWYQVELVVFSRTADVKIQPQTEHQRRDITLGYPDNWVLLQSVQGYVAEQQAVERQRQQTLDNEKFFTDFSRIDEPENNDPAGGDLVEELIQNESQEAPEELGSDPLPSPPIEALTPDYSELDPDTPDQENQIEEDIEDHEPDYSLEPYLFLPDEELALIEQVDALRKDKSYQVLFHQSWRQAMLSRSDAPALIVLGGNHYGPHRQLEGSITISIARYLHLDTQLWLSEFEPNYGQRQNLMGTPETETPWPELPAIPSHQKAAEAFALSAADTFWQNPLNVNSLLGSSDVDDIIAKPFLTRNITKLKQKRRMRSNEIHYIDHPSLGLVITLTPYEPPQVKENGSVEALQYEEGQSTSRDN